MVTRAESERLAELAKLTELAEQDAADYCEKRRSLNVKRWYGKSKAQRKKAEEAVRESTQLTEGEKPTTLEKLIELSPEKKQALFDNFDFNDATMEERINLMDMVKAVLDEVAETLEREGWWDVSNRREVWNVMNEGMRMEQAAVRQLTRNEELWDFFGIPAGVDLGVCGEGSGSCGSSSVV